MTKRFAWLPTKVTDRNINKQKYIWFRYYYRQLNYAYGYWFYYNFIPETTNVIGINKTLRR